MYVWAVLDVRLHGRGTQQAALRATCGGSSSTPNKNRYASLRISSSECSSVGLGCLQTYLDVCLYILSLSPCYIHADTRARSSVRVSRVSLLWVVDVQWRRKGAGPSQCEQKKIFQKQTLRRSCPGRSLFWRIVTETDHDEDARVFRFSFFSKYGDLRSERPRCCEGCTTSWRSALSCLLAEVEEREEEKERLTETERKSAIEQGSLQGFSFHQVMKTKQKENL